MNGEVAGTYTELIHKANIAAPTDGIQRKEISCKNMYITYATYYLC